MEAPGTSAVTITTSWQMEIKNCYGWLWVQTPQQKPPISDHARSTEGGSLWYSAYLHRDHWGENMGQTIKQPSSFGFTVNLHHSSIFLPVALNINMDSWGGQDPVLPGVKLVIYAKETPAKPLIGGHGLHWDFMGHRYSWCWDMHLLLILIQYLNSDIMFSFTSIYIYFLKGDWMNEAQAETGIRQWNSGQLCV